MDTAPPTQHSSAPSVNKQEVTEGAGQDDKREAEGSELLNFCTLKRETYLYIFYPVFTDDVTGDVTDNITLDVSDDVTDDITGFI